MAELGETFATLAYGPTGVGAIANDRPLNTGMLNAGMKARVQRQRRSFQALRSRR